jgi:hypothetical protein
MNAHIIKTFKMLDLLLVVIAVTLIVLLLMNTIQTLLVSVDCNDPIAILSAVSWND